MSTADCVSSPCFFCLKQVSKIVFGTRRVELYPNPVTAANLDKYRMLDEWQQEFLAEGRRRTDLVRWDAYVTEDWWDHKATNNKNFNRFPIHYSVLEANQKLKQNPGYGRD